MRTKSITKRQVKYTLKEKECLCNSRKGSPSVTLRKASSPRRSSPHPWNEFVKAYREDNPGLSYKQVLISASAVYRKTKGGSQPSYDNSYDQGYDDSYSPFLPSSPPYKPFSPPPKSVSPKGKPSTKKKASSAKKKSPTPAKKKYNTRVNPKPKKQFPLLQRRIRRS